MQVCENVWIQSFHGHAWFRRTNFSFLGQSKNSRTPKLNFGKTSQLLLKKYRDREFIKI